MKIYLLQDPGLYDMYARFSHVGTWSDGGFCSACGEATSNLIEPLQIEWDPGSDRIGDFSWCGYVAAVTDNVKSSLSSHGFDCEYRKTEVMKPQNIEKYNTVDYPYKGPALNWVLPKSSLMLNEKMSRVDLSSDCGECGQKLYTFRREGIVIDSSQWNGEKIFSIVQFDKTFAIFSTEEGLQEILYFNFTNLGYSECGYIK